jgi:LmbE family N-acetylglucosaminyl deacetylase
MLNLCLGKRDTSPLRILCLGAHCDDIEIGCGGTILNLAATRSLAVQWVVFSSDEERKREAMNSANAFLENVVEGSITIHDFRDGFFPYVGGAIKEHFEKLKTDFSPDIILTHHRHDLHQDHRLVSELTWNTFRNHLILEYEIPKYDGDFGSPNLFCSLDEPTCKRKINIILDAYQSQRGRHWFSGDLFTSILRLRGMEANACSGYAEGFYSRKALLGILP